MPRLDLPRCSIVLQKVRSQVTPCYRARKDRQRTMRLWTPTLCAISVILWVADEPKFRRFLTAVAGLTARSIVYTELARLAGVDQKTAKAWRSLLVSSYLVKLVVPNSNNLLR